MEGGKGGRNGSGGGSKAHTNTLLNYHRGADMYDILNYVSSLLGPKLIFVTGFVKFVTAVARLVCPDLLG